MGKFVFPVIWGTLMAGCLIEGTAREGKNILNVAAGYTER
jgi:hypothetical protein